VVPAIVTGDLLPVAAFWISLGWMPSRAAA
jgi:hypothetical protein